jgi:hypothetical protein
MLRLQWNSHVSKSNLSSYAAIATHEEYILSHLSQREICLFQVEYRTQKLPGFSTNYISNIQASNTIHKSNFTCTGGIRYFTTDIEFCTRC